MAFGLNYLGRKEGKEGDRGKGKDNTVLANYSSAKSIKAFLFFANKKPD